MSFCPSKDIHSIYLDNEMPDIYKAEYEAHLKNCESCQKELEKLRALHQLFKADSESISLNKQYLDQSFDRLMVKMNYSKHTKFTEKKPTAGIKYFIPAAAAAAVIALVVPLRLNSSVKNTASQQQVVASTASVAPTMVSTVASPMVASEIPANVRNVSVGGGKGVVISGNIHESVLPSASIGTSGTNNSFVQNVSNSTIEKKLIQDVDVFRPGFIEDKTISIKITVPGMNAVPVTTEIELPVSVTTGQFE